MNIKKLFWIVAIILIFLIGLYPISYLFFDFGKYGLLTSKSNELIASFFYKFGFYTHIIPGGIALLIGWSQFVKKYRNKNIQRHRTIGKIYIITALLSGMGGLYISFFATGGLIVKLGFGVLASLWLITTLSAYSAIRKKKIKQHQNWMIRSYALCLAAVTLRLWQPLLIFVLHVDGRLQYEIVAWLSWVPNIIFAEFLIHRISRKKVLKFKKRHIF